ncbi:MAG: hypothetical protein AAF393_01460 [Pseudomonadota bacterium]
MALHEKRKDLDSEKQKALLRRLVAELSGMDPDFYYRPTAEIAQAIKTYISGSAKLVQEERALLDKLSVRDVEVLLSLH